MRMAIYVLLALFGIPSVANAGFWGPSNYEECVLENMKGVRSDQAAKAICMACRKKFPTPVKEKVVRNRSDFPGFPFDESTYANKLLNWYIMDYGSTDYSPERIAFWAYEKRSADYSQLTYKQFADQNNLNFFIKKAQEFDLYMKGD